MSTATVYRDGKSIRTTVLSAADADKFVILAAAVRDAQAIMRGNPENSAIHDGLNGVSHDAGIAYSESHPDDAYSVMGRLGELLGTHARAIYPHLDERLNGDVLRNTDGTPKHGLMLAHKNTPVPEPFDRAAGLSATALGMFPLDNGRFDYTVLEDAPPAGSGVPQIRAYVRWRV